MGAFPRCLVCMALAALVGCAGPGVEREGDPALVATLRISPTPPMTGEATVSVRVTDAGAPLTEAASVTASPGRSPGSGRPQALEHRGAGRWEGRVDFAAPGVAMVEVSVALPEGRGARFRFPVTVARRPGS